MSPPRPYASQRPEMIRYFELHGSVPSHVRGAAEIDKGLNFYVRQQEARYPFRGTPYNTYKGEKNAWTWFFGEDADKDFRGISPGVASQPPPSYQPAPVRPLQPAPAPLPNRPVRI